MSKKSDDFITYLEKKIRQYRLEMLTDFIQTPQLLMGDGLRSFEILSLLFPVINIGPSGHPVPAGSFVESTGRLRYPAQGLTSGGTSRDSLYSLDTRIRHMNDSMPGDGQEVVSESMDTNWKALNINATDGAGAVALCPALSGFFAEVCIYYIQVAEGYQDAAVPVRLNLGFDATGGGIDGENLDININYLYDVTNVRFDFGNVHQAYPNGKRFICDTDNEAPQVTVSGGSTNEIVILGLNYRYHPL